MSEQTEEPKRGSRLCRRTDVHCRGVTVDTYQECWAHLSPEDFEQALSRRKPGDPIDARGTTLSSRRLNDLLLAMRQGNRPQCGEARFDRALFDKDASFDGVLFKKGACFHRAQFKGPAKFGQAQFEGPVSFKLAQFEGCAEFEGAKFKGDTRFDGARFHEEARFRDAEFCGNTRFNRGRFCKRASFRGAHFLRDARFMGTRFDDDARLEEASLEGERILGPVLVKGRLALDETLITRHLVLEALAHQVTCIGTEFRQGATIRLRWADAVLDHCTFGQPTTISFAQQPFRVRRGGLTPEGGLGGQLFLDREKALNPAKLPATLQPRLLSMRGVDVSNLTLAEVDLGRCIFQGAHKRAELRIVGAQLFADTPERKILGIPWRRWTHRQALAEEHWYRACYKSHQQALAKEPRDGTKKPWYTSCCNGRKGKWNRPERGSLEWLANVTGQDIELLGPDRLASIYRALRKAQEDIKNQPGAADFYYGEMEMRRKKPGRRFGWAEWFILTLYWLVSGYGLRALRTLLTLLMLLAAATVLIAAWGFPNSSTGTTLTATIVGTPPRQRVQLEPQPTATVTNRDSFASRLENAALVALEGAAFRTREEQQLKPMGRVIQDLVRIVGPVLIGLTLLSVSNRVKR